MRDEIATKPKEPAYARTRSCLRCGADLTLGFIPPGCEAHGHVPHDARAWLTLDAHAALGWCDREWTNAHDLGACLVEGIAALRTKTSAAQVEQEAHGAPPVSIRAPRQGDAPIRSGAPPTILPPAAREHARRRGALDGADAQALEHALTITERDRDAHAARNRGATQAVIEAIGAIGPESVEDAVARALTHLRTAEAERDKWKTRWEQAQTACDATHARLAESREDMDAARQRYATAERELAAARTLLNAHPGDRIVLASAHRLSDPEWESATIEFAFAKVRDLTRERDGARADLASAEIAIDRERAFVASLFEVAGKHGIRPDDEKLGDFIERLAGERDALAWAANPASRCAEQPCPCECHRTDIDEPAPHVEGCIFHEGRASELTPEDELPW